MTRRVGIGRTIVWSGIVSSLFFFVTPLAPQSRPEPFLIAAFMCEAGLGMLYNINQLTLRQTITPQRLLGRMTSVVRFMYLGSAPLGFVIGGVIASQLGLRAALFFAAAGSTAAMVPLAFSGIRKLETLPESEPQREPLHAAVPAVALPDA